MAKVADPNKMAKLQEAMSRASKLMKLESNGTLDKIAKSHKNEIGESLNGVADITTESMMSTSRKRGTQAPIVGGAMTGAGAENVPSIIRESFAKNPINDAELYKALGNNGGDLSFLTEGMTQKTPSMQEIRQLVNEGVAQPQQFTQATQQVDYPMIRTIVEEIVRKYTVSLKNKILTEGKTNVNEVNTIALGKTFKFLDNSGNIYECTMKKIGNLKDKKENI